jgi:hypothetical protein
MSLIEAFALGALVAWTPSLVFMALLLWRAPYKYDAVGGLNHPLMRSGLSKLPTAETKIGRAGQVRVSAAFTRTRRSTQSFALRSRRGM